MKTATAILHIEYMLEARAYRIADRYDIRDHESFRLLVEQERYQAFREAIAPWIQMRARIHCLRLVRRILFWPDEGRTEVEYELWSPETQATLDSIEEYIAAEVQRYGYPPRTPENWRTL